MQKSSLSVILSMTLVFLSGAFVGALGHQLYTVKSVSANVAPRTPEEVRMQIVNEMKTRLNLRPDQLPKLSAVLDVSRTRYNQFREKYKPEVKDIRDDQIRDIKQFLDPAQQAEYDKLLEEKDRERRLREGK
jgi:hypothetical protein